MMRARRDNEGTALIPCFKQHKRNARPPSPVLILHNPLLLQTIQSKLELSPCATLNTIDMREVPDPAGTRDGTEAEPRSVANSLQTLLAASSV